MASLAIDIGSSFADLAYTNGESLQVLKFPVGMQSEGGAVMSAIDHATIQFGFAISDLTSVRIGSTGALNAVLHRKGARIALLTSEGFTDTFFLARQNRQDLYDPVAKSRAPTFLLQESDVFPVTGRIGADGKEVIAPDKDEIAKIAAQIAKQDIDAIAVCLLFAHLNPAHELACLKVLEQHCPDLPVSLSHRVDPQPREYERTVSVCLDAWLKPRFLQSCQEISNGLANQGFGGQIMFGDGRGTLMSLQSARLLPANALASGPAAAARHGATISARQASRARLIIDVGSVSCDLSYAPVDLTPMLVSGAVYGGVPVRRDMIDLQSLSLGARHFAVLDADKSVSFKSGDAGAFPTLELALRACERLGPDVTDEEAEPLRKLAGIAGWNDAKDAAHQIIAAAELEIAAALVNFAVRRNIDPAQAHLVAMGGVGPLLAPGIASILSIQEILLPHAPAVAGAVGLLGQAPRFEATMGFALPLDDISEQQLSQCYQELQADISQQTVDFGDIALQDAITVVTIAATPQMHPLQFEMATIPKTAEDIAKAFRATYFERFSIAPPGDGHLFSILLRRDGMPAPQPDADHNALRADAAKTSRFYTEAGTIHVPEDWDITPTNGGFSLFWKAAGK